VCGIDCLACQDKLFVNNPLDVKENYEHVFVSAFHLSLLFQSALNRVCHHPCTVHAYISLPAEPLSYFFSDPLRNHIRPDTRLQMREHNKSARSPSCVKFCTLTPKICQYHYLSLHRATTTAAQMAVAVPEIMDTPSLFYPTYALHFSGPNSYYL
jgi:hypothetical protein